VSGEVGPLAGYTIGITAARRREEFAVALERRGARVISGPAIRIVPLADDSDLLAATQRCLDGPLDFVVATTGIGFRGWIEAADAWGLADKLTAAIGQAAILARGPKARGAVRACGLRESWSPESESSSEVLAHLIAGPGLDGMRIAVQLHGEPLPDLVAALRLAGAEVIEVPVYRWVLPDDTGPLHRLLASVAAAALDAVAFTSAPAAASFLQAAADQGCADAVRAALGGPVVPACVGPVTARPFQEAGIPVIQPSRGRLGARDSGTSAAAAAMAMIPTGTLIRKIGRQSRPNRLCWMSSPPSSGPLTVPRPAVTPKPASALIRSRGGKMTWMTDSTCGTMIAPIAPCATRQAMSMPGPCAAPHRAEKTVKPATPIRNSRLRPNMSPSRPPVISTSA